MENKILKSFIVKDTLNPKVWDYPDNIKKAKIKPEIKKALLNIAKEFIEFLDEEMFIEDIILTGSLSNYNWSEYSDFDLHIIIDLEQFEGDGDVYLKLFSAKKLIFNEKHNLTIKNYDVEVYPQDDKEDHSGEGQYSIMNEDWLVIPKKDKPSVNKSKLKLKINHWVNFVKKTLKDADESSLKVSKTKIKKLTDKLKKFRQGGLEKGGEFSNENLVYKYLRRSGLLDKVFNYQYKKRTKELSVENEIN
ncbi:MAG: nucleotidyltransferase domain-containing protein [Chitinophagaceae bacterium]|nr:nucleotidyltransferase domain-containing protein [Chitinophagaceae bacterium]